ncbi:receptor like protein 29 [Wolffia australiana]
MAGYFAYVWIAAVGFISAVAGGEDWTGGMELSEREMLFAVLEAVSSDRDWRDPDADPCAPGASWPGVDCATGSDGRLHVTRLAFGAPLSPTCKPAATFPAPLFSLPHLQSASFYACFRTRETRLAVPDNASAPLQQLSLRSNPALSGPIPAGISGLRSLRVLTLSQNGLRGRIPESMSELAGLVHVDLSYNALSGPIPAGLASRLRALVGLDLSYNALSGPVPAGIGAMAALQKLDLSRNALAGPVPAGLVGLGSLTFAALGGNRLTGPLPPGLWKLVNLQYLILEDSPIRTELPAELGRLKNLQELRLANSGLWGQIPDSFSGLGNLTTLSLQNNSLSGSIPPALGKLPRIYHLNLSGNSLRGEVLFNGSFLRRLGRNLDLRGNAGLCVGPAPCAVTARLDLPLCGELARNATADQHRLPQELAAIAGGGDRSLTLLRWLLPLTACAFLF